MYQMIEKDSLIEMLIEANNNIKRLTSKNLNLYYPLSIDDVYLEKSENSTSDTLSNVLHLLRDMQEEYPTFLNKDSEVQSVKSLVENVEKLIKQVEK